MTDTFSEKTARAIAAEALTYKRPSLADSPKVQAFSITPDQVKEGNDKRDRALATALNRFKRK
ncbi:protein of unknown function [Beijerinckiaceae bacterium RH AL1]|nr:hypothetical protein [Beijerinckiaceae bacterium]VVB44993.1 protein of unknown function [Beijerinckiaceae bacterium RH CH11]VVB45072.1 protein of unknown function [Beijerinckiaceae bacterium RH AL8]VVC54641.1 protein of unknown function [Beijerinckiaceae bacterium RH AL1]